MNQDYWDKQYQTKATGWDLGQVSPAIKEYIETLEKKNIRILIPGCGNSYEAEFLLHKGFNNITIIDIAPTLIEKLQEKYGIGRHVLKSYKKLLTELRQNKIE